MDDLNLSLNRPRQDCEDIDSLVNEIVTAFSATQNHPEGLLGPLSGHKIAARIPGTHINYIPSQLIKEVLLPAALFYMAAGSLTHSQLISYGLVAMKSFHAIDDSAFCVYLHSIKLSKVGILKSRYFSSSEIKEDIFACECMARCKEIKCAHYIDENCTLTDQKINQLLVYLSDNSILCHSVHGDVVTYTIRK